MKKLGAGCHSGCHQLGVKQQLFCYYLVITMLAESPLVLIKSPRSLCSEPDTERVIHVNM